RRIGQRHQEVSASNCRCRHFAPSFATTTASVSNCAPCAGIVSMGRTNSQSVDLVSEARGDHAGYGCETAVAILEHDPEKCAAVFGKDHAQTKSSHSSWRQGQPEATPTLNSLSRWQSRGSLPSAIGMAHA